MKFLYFVLAFVPLLSFGQADKDSLLAKDYNTLQQQLTLMHYLDQAAMHFYSFDKKTASAIDFKAYYDTLLAGNPTAINIDDFLDYRESKHPKYFDQFAQRVFVTNIEKLIKITKIYGYLSSKRFKFIYEDKITTALQFTLRDSTYNKTLAKLFKQEYKIGNMPEIDFIFFDTLKNSGGVLTEKDIARMEKAGVKIHESDPSEN